MYLAQLTVKNFRQFGDGNPSLTVDFNQGVTAIVGQNDSGKTAIIDSIRYALLTRDQEYIRVQPEDFHIDQAGTQATEILICCKMADLSDEEKGAFAEYLSYQNGSVFLVINWTARKIKEPYEARRWIDVSVRSGINAAGPVFESSVRDMLSAAYLRPLRDAEREMSPGRGSRLSQILANVSGVKQGEAFNETTLPSDADAVKRLSILGLADYLRYGIQGHAGIVNAEQEINERYLSSFSLAGDKLYGKINITDGGNDDTRLRQILERLELGLRQDGAGQAMGRYGLGSNNLLYVACELLLLGREPEGLPLLLIEEPEAHLHPQRQLRLMEFLETAANGRLAENNRPVQVVLTTHSPNLASKTPLSNMVLLERGYAFSLAKGATKLQKSDYRFLERFLDVTKANLFFAHGVLVVEGDAEAILLPTIAKLLGMDLTEHGVSIVNVGSTGLRRFSRIFQRAEAMGPTLSVPVACLADRDIMPDCAPAILKLVKDDNDEMWRSSKRRWRAVRDFGGDASGINAKIEAIKGNDGQKVRTFVSDQWTLEFDLAFYGLAEHVFVAAKLAKNDEAINQMVKKRSEIMREARAEYNILRENNSDNVALCSHIYKLFHSENASKAIAAQYLAEILAKIGSAPGFGHAVFKEKLPPYIVDAILYVTGTELSSAGDNNA